MFKGHLTVKKVGGMILNSYSKSSTQAPGADSPITFDDNAAEYLLKTTGDNELLGACR
jgi:hypothetical protein